MCKEYLDKIYLAKEEASILDAIMEVQSIIGYLSNEAINDIAEVFQMMPEEVYETASFYSMIKFEPKYDIEVKLCKSAPCHVAGAHELISTIEEILGVKAGIHYQNSKHYFGFVECLGQCGNGPAMLVNNQLYTNLNREIVKDILKKEVGKYERN